MVKIEDEATREVFSNQCAKLHAMKHQSEIVSDFNDIISHIEHMSQAMRDYTHALKDTGLDSDAIERKNAHYDKIIDKLTNTIVEVLLMGIDAE